MNNNIEIKINQKLELLKSRLKESLNNNKISQKEYNKRIKKYVTK